MSDLRSNTATRVTVGPFLDATDGVTPEVALTVTNDHLTLMVDTGGVPTLALDADATASGGDNDMVHVTNDNAGYYDLELTAAQLNYVGRAKLAITDAVNHVPVFHEFDILPADEYDAKYGLGAPTSVTVLAVEVPYGQATVVRVPLPGIVGSPSIAAGDATITQDDGIGVDNVDNAPSIVDNTLVWTISAAEATAPSANGTYRIMRLRDQTSPQVFGRVDVLVITTDHQSAVKPNGVIRQVTPDATPGATSFAVTDAALPTTALGAKFKASIALVVASDVADDVNCCALVTSYSKSGNIGTFTYGAWTRTPTGTAANIRINLYAAAIGQVEALNAVALAAIKAEVVDAVATDTYAEPGQGAPAATATLAQKIGYLFKAWRNRHTQSASEYALYADDATTKDQEAVVSDNGTLIDRGEVGTGA